MPKARAQLVCKKFRCNIERIKIVATNFRYMNLPWPVISVILVNPQ
jgi:hypothetical protein